MIEPISRGQFFVLVAISVVAGGIYIWPQALLADAGMNAPWAYFGSVALALGMVFIQTAWPPDIPGATGLARLRPLWGWLRWPLFGATLSVYLILGGALVTLFSHMLHMEFYPQTPLWVFDLSTVGFAGWYASQSLTHLARNVQWWFPLMVASFAMLVFMALGSVHEYAALRPSFIFSIGPIVHAVVSTWYLWIQNDLIITVGAYVRDTSWKQIRNWALAAVGFQAGILGIVYMLVVGTLGTTMGQRLAWPITYVFTNLTVQTLFISKPGLIVIITWVLLLTLYLAVHIFTFSLSLQDAHTLSNRGRQVFVWGTAILIAGVALLLPSPLVATHLIMTWIDPVSLGLIFSTSLVTLGLAHRYRRKHHPPLRSSRQRSP